MLNTLRIVSFGAAVGVAAIAFQASMASAATMAECSAMYQKDKAANALNGMKWNDYRKAKCADGTAAAPAAPAPAAPAAAAANNNDAACSANWKAWKDRGDRPKGLKLKDFRASGCQVPAAGAAATTAPAAPAATAAAPATGGSFLSQCAANWKAWGAAGRPATAKFTDFVAGKCQLPAGVQAAAPAAVPAKPGVPAANTGTMVDKNGKPLSAGRAAMIKRERACGAEWKTVKGTARVAPGTTWPQFWHECDLRMKAAGQ